MTTPSAVQITVTADEIAAVCEALRYMASDMSTVATIHRRNEVSQLRGLAYQFEARYAAAASEAASVEMLTGVPE